MLFSEHVRNSTGPERIPIIVLYAGIGGIEMGFAVQPEDSNLRYVTVLAVECEAETHAVHQLTHPSVPCVRYKLGDLEDSLRLIAGYLPPRLWSRAWVHSSPSCRQASSVNNTNRDLAAAADSTQQAIDLMQRLDPAVWTLEQAPTLYDHFRGSQPFVETMRMPLYCELPQDRVRLIMSNRELTFSLVDFHPSMRDCLAERKGWPPEEGSSTHRMKNSYANERTIDAPAYAVCFQDHHRWSRSAC